MFFTEMKFQLKSYLKMLKILIGKGTRLFLSLVQEFQLF